MKFLVGAGAKVDAENLNGSTPLASACENGHLDIAEYLLAAGADIETARAHRDGFTPLVAASYKGYVEIATFLLDHGADIHVWDDAPLEWACLHQQLGMMAFLVTRGANVNATAGNGVTILGQVSDDGNEVVAAFLVRHGADPDLAGPDGTTARDAAVRGNRSALIELFNGTAEP